MVVPLLSLYQPKQHLVKVEILLLHSKHMNTISKYSSTIFSHLMQKVTGLIFKLRCKIESSISSLVAEEVDFEFILFNDFFYEE